MLGVPLIKKDKKSHDDHFNPSLRIAHSKSLPVPPTSIPKRTSNPLTEDEHLRTSFTNCRDEQSGHVLDKCNILTMKYFSRRQKWRRHMNLMGTTFIWNLPAHPVRHALQFPGERIMREVRAKKTHFSGSQLSSFGVECPSDVQTPTSISSSVAVLQTCLLFFCRRWYYCWCAAGIGRAVVVGLPFHQARGTISTFLRVLAPSPRKWRCRLCHMQLNIFFFAFYSTNWG